MSERLYVDPVTNSVREERAIFQFVQKKLNKSYGQMFRLGVLTYARVLAESGEFDESTLSEYRAIADRDKDYLDRLLIERLHNDQSTLDKAYSIELPKAPKRKKSLTDFFNENIRDVLPSELFTTYTFTIMNSLSAAEQISVINRLLDEAGAYNDNKTGAGSHDTNEVYNWLVEVRRGGL